MLGIVVLTALNACAWFAMLVIIRDHAAERKDMLDRLMSRDLQEYKEHVTPMDLPSGPAVMSDADEWAREIEMEKSGAR